MAKKPKKEKPKITCKSYIHVGDRLVDTATLNKEQKDYLGAVLTVQMLNASHRGEVEFTVDLPPSETVFPRDMPAAECLASQFNPTR